MAKVFTTLQTTEQLRADYLMNHDPYDHPNPVGSVRVCPICDKVGTSEVFDKHMDVAHPNYDWATFKPRAEIRGEDQNVVRA